MIHNIGFSDYGWDDLRVPLTATRVGAAAPPDFSQVKDNGAASTGVFAYHFDKAIEQQVYFETQMPHDWQNGTTIYPHIHWMGIDTEASVQVGWGIEYNITAIHSTMGNTTILYGDTPISGDTGVTAFKHQLTALGAGIDMSAFVGLSAVITARVFRDATGAGTTDDYDDDAVGLSIDFHYRRWRLGSTSPTGQ